MAEVTALGQLKPRRRTRSSGCVAWPAISVARKRPEPLGLHTLLRLRPRFDTPDRGSGHPPPATAMIPRQDTNGPHLAPVIVSEAWLGPRRRDVEASGQPPVKSMIREGSHRPRFRAVPNALFAPQGPAGQARNRRRYSPGVSPTIR